MACDLSQRHPSRWILPERPGSTGFCRVLPGRPRFNGFASLAALFLLILLVLILGILVGLLVPFAEYSRPESALLGGRFRGLFRPRVPSVLRAHTRALA